MDKQVLRNALKRKRSGLSQGERSQWDEQILKHLLNWDTFQEVKCIMTYLSFGWEINTWPLVEWMLSAHKEVCVPVVQKEPKTLLPIVYTKETTMKPGPFGILEPHNGQTVDPSSIDLIIVPGLAFSPDGYRIGYGGGYYDRFLSAVSGVRVGLCYSQFIRNVPVEPWDQPVHYVITERGRLGQEKLPF